MPVIERQHEQGPMAEWLSATRHRPLGLLVLGPSGAGKTTLVRALLAVAGGIEQTMREPALSIAARWCVAAGHFAGAAVDGGDIVPRNRPLSPFDYWHRNLSWARPLFIMDGMHFGRRSVASAMRSRGLRILAVHLEMEVPDAWARARARGSGQDLEWATLHAKEMSRTADEHLALRVDGGDAAGALLATQRLVGWAPPERGPIEGLGGDHGDSRPRSEG